MGKQSLNRFIEKNITRAFSQRAADDDVSVYAHAPENDSGGPTVHTIPQPALISIALQYSIDLHDLKLAILISEEVGRYEPENKLQILAETLETLIGLTPNDSHRVADWVYGG
jgi:hypothetical protein